MPDPLSLGLLLAMVCAAEVSIQPDVQECQVMWGINASEAARREISLEQHTREFNAMFSQVGATQLERTRPWVTRLSRDTQAAPQGWGSLDWPGRYRARWQAYLAAADAFVATPGPVLCPAAHDYGGRCDDDKGSCDPPHACYRRVLCLRGETLQAYWNLSYCRSTSWRRSQVLTAGTMSQ